MKKSNQTAIGFFLLVFFSMCFLRLWYTMLIVFVIAFGMTFVKKKRSYCSNVCPVGYLQDFVHDSDTEGPKKKRLNSKAWIRKGIFVVFWGYIIIYVGYLYHQPALLWSKMFQLMVFSMIAALLLQNAYGKRFWCSHLCPVGGILGQIVKIQRR